MTRSERGLAALIGLLLAFGLLVPAGVRAAERDEVAARVLFRDGRRLAAGGDYAGACAKFEASYQLDPGIGTNFNLADCYEHIGRIASAWARFLDVAAATHVANQPERERVARTRASTLEPRLPRLIVTVAARPPGLAVQREGISVPETAWGTAVPIDPGEHVISATAPGKNRWSTTLIIGEGPETSSLMIPELDDWPPPAPAPSPPPVLPAAVPRPPILVDPLAKPPPVRRRLTKPIVATGALAIVGFAAASVFGVKFLVDNGQAKALCADNVCPSIAEKVHHDSLVTSAQRDRAIGFVSAGIGVAAAAITAGYLRWRW